MRILLLVGRGLVYRHDRRHVLLVHPLRERIAAVLLERHAGAVEPDRRDRVSVEDPEEVVRLVVEVPDPLTVELGGHRGPVDPVDPVVRLVGDLVIHGVGVRREEVRERPHLVDVEVQHGREPSKELELRVRLRLSTGEPVAVHVDVVGVAARVRLAAVWALHGDEHDDRVVEDRLGDAVGASGELVEQLERGLRAALLAPVDVGLHQQDRRGGGGQRTDVGLGLGIPELRDRRVDGGRHSRLLIEVVRIAGDRVIDRPTFHRVTGDPARDTIARVVERFDVRVRFGDRDLPGAERRERFTVERDLLRSRHVLGEDGIREDRMTGRLGCCGGEGHAAEQQERCDRACQEPLRDASRHPSSSVHSGPQASGSPAATSTAQVGRYETGRGSIPSPRGHPACVKEADERGTDQPLDRREGRTRRVG